MCTFANSFVNICNIIFTELQVVCSFSLPIRLGGRAALLPGPKLVGFEPGTAFVNTHSICNWPPPFATETLQSMALSQVLCLTSRMSLVEKAVELERSSVQWPLPRLSLALDGGNQSRSGTMDVEDLQTAKESGVLCLSPIEGCVPKLGGPPSVRDTTEPLTRLRQRGYLLEPGV